MGQSDEMTTAHLKVTGHPMADRINELIEIAEAHRFVLLGSDDGITVMLRRMAGVTMWANAAIYPGCDPGPDYGQMVYSGDPDMMARERSGVTAYWRPDEVTP